MKVALCDRRVRQSASHRSSRPIPTPQGPAPHASGTCRAAQTRTTPISTKTIAMSSEPDCPLLRQISAAGQSSWAFCDGFYAGVAVQHSGTLGGYLVATRAFSRLGEVIIDEQPLLEADTNGGDDWAEPLFRVFCAAPAERQADVLKMYSGKGNVNQGVRLRNDISVQVQRCVGKPWRRGVSDETLTAVCLVFSLNAYPSQAQDSCNALFPLGGDVSPLLRSKRPLQLGCAREGFRQGSRPVPGPWSWRPSMRFRPLRGQT